MRSNKLTPGSNLVWESSRMMLPEHREALLAYVQKCRQMERPELDEQQLERISRVIQQAHIHKSRVDLVVFNQYGHRHYQGQVRKMDQLAKKLLLVYSGGKKWIPFRDILDARLYE